ncbi:hypothetical protein KQX54_016154 [Cotesia glomerata]|uniref:Uncharacterized protein n=1 Tax=Cotesia glomerata TaxID=32391 RepID=A0AAV7HZA9_COTGL|nr:hypothetical protein KQX54_016154 [Cotesia glomerata]
MLSAEKTRCEVERRRSFGHRQQVAVKTVFNLINGCHVCGLGENRVRDTSTVNDRQSATNPLNVNKSSILGKNKSSNCLDSIGLLSWLNFSYVWRKFVFTAKPVHDPPAPENLKVGANGPDTLQ